MTRLVHIISLLVLASPLVTAAPTSTYAPRARMIAVPKPIYPAEAIQRHVQGVGQFRIDIDIDTGKPIRVVVLKSTGSRLLDDAAVKALQQWRAAPGAIRVINLPLFFRISSRGPSIEFQ